MLKRFKSTNLSEFSDTSTALFLLRFFSGAFMLYGHGWGKLVNVFSGKFQFLDPIGLGPEISLILSAFAEGICSLLLMAGFYTRAAAAVLMANMSVAFLFVHLTQSFGKMEVALVYLVMFSTVFLLGPGKYSIDSRLN